MPFYQNVFRSEFEGNWVLADRHYMPTFIVKPNAGREDESVCSWTNAATFDLSGNDADGDAKDTLTIFFSLHDPKNWATLNVDITAEADSASACTAEEIVASLNADTLFTERFTASVVPFTRGQSNKRVVIRQKKPITEFKFYIGNSGAETVLRFNARAGVAELPTYFGRHTIENRFTYPDSQGLLIELDPDANDVDASVIDNAVSANGTSLGYDSGTVQEDWQLLRGRSGLFQFKKVTLEDDKITEIIEYPAGALAGDLAKKTIYTYVDDASNPSEIMEIPYVLQDADLLTPS